MAYRLDPTRPLALEVRRVLDEELATAIEELRAPGGPDAEGVHDVRRRIKKTRSLLRLARAQYGPNVVRLAQGELRDVAASLASQREADARRESLSGLAGDLIGEDAELVASIAAEIEVEAASDGLDRRTVLGAVAQLQRTGGWLARLPARVDGWDAIGPGLRRQYALGRRSLRHLPDHPTAHELHEWRKRAKDLWYHERLLRDAWPAGTKPVARAAGTLGELLGDDHDLAMVAGALGAPVVIGLPGEPLAPALALALPASTRARALGLIAARRAELQARARHLGALLWADTPATWVARHRRWWEEAQASAPDPSPAGPTA